MNYLSNAFSLQMLDLASANMIKVTPVEDSSSIISAVKAGEIVSTVGHEDLANLLGVPFNRVSLSLTRGDILYVAQVTGGRLPLGCTTLPKGIGITLVRVEIV